MQRIAIVGTTGSGKSTLATKAATKLGCPFIELDALFWKPNWVQEEKGVFRQKVSDALSGTTWAVGGNYSIARDIIWQRADTLVWLDYAFGLVLGRLFRRTLRRVITQEELWSGNRESWRNAFMSRESLFLYAVRTHFRRRRELPLELKRNEYQHLKVYHFTTTQQTETWLQELSNISNQ